MLQVIMAVMSSFSDALFTKTQQKVLGLLYGQPEQSLYFNEIVRLADMGKGTIKRELEKMHIAGLLTVTRQGNQNHYQANHANPIYTELCAIVQKMSGAGYSGELGIEDIITACLKPLASKIEKAFLFGSIVSGSEHANSDIEILLVVKGLSYTEVTEKLREAETQIKRSIIPTLYEQSEFVERQKKNQFFIRRVMAQPKIWLVGEE